MAPATFKIPPQLDEKSRARLESKTYKTSYTDVPNRVLPENYKNGLGAIYRALTGEDFDMEGHTFTVRADPNGTFVKLYPPTVFANEEGELLIRWGNKDIPLAVSAGKIAVPNAAKGTKFSFKDEQVGKYSEPVLSISVTHDGTVYSLPVPIKKKEIKEDLTADLLDSILDLNPETLASKVYVAPDPSKRGENKTGERLVGPYIKVSCMPLGEYKVTACRSKEGGQFGTEYYLQVQITEPFSAPVRTQVEGEWVEEEREIRDWAIIRPNTSMKKVLAADPVITPEFPATMAVVEHFEYNGKPAAKVNLKISTFVEDPDSFALDF